MARGKQSFAQHINPIFFILLQYIHLSYIRTRSTMAATQFISQIGAFANATLKGSTTLSSALKAASIPNDIYAGVDFDALTWPEQLWAQVSER